MEKYKGTQEFYDQLPAWADKWIENAFQTGLYSPAQVEDIHHVINKLYEAADLKKPEKITVCSDPVAAVYATCIVSVARDMRENPENYKGPSGELPTEEDIREAVDDAVGSLFSDKEEDMAALTRETIAAIL